MTIDDFTKNLDLDSDTFEDMKRNFNFVLQRLLGNMEEKKSREGSLTLKLDISLVSEFIPNYDPKINGETREIHKPNFKHKITSVVKINDEKSGNLDSKMELYMDEYGVYKMKPIANTQQRSIFDSDFREVYPDAETVEGEVVETDETALPGRKVMSLPGPSAESSKKEGTKKCTTGWSKYGTCNCCGHNGVTCCAQCQEDCNSRCGWIDEPYQPDEEPEDITDELLEEDEGYDYDEPDNQ